MVVWEEGKLLLKCKRKYNYLGKFASTIFGLTLLIFCEQNNHLHWPRITPWWNYNFNIVPFFTFYLIGGPCMWCMHAIFMLCGNLYSLQRWYSKKWVHKAFLTIKRGEKTPLAPDNGPDKIIMLISSIALILNQIYEARVRNGIFRVIGSMYKSNGIFLDSIITFSDIKDKFRYDVAK